LEKRTVGRPCFTQRAKLTGSAILLWLNPAQEGADGQEIHGEPVRGDSS
jgi:hypothetical protein